MYHWGSTDRFIWYITKSLHVDFQKYFNFALWPWNWVCRGFRMANLSVDPQLYIVWIFPYYIPVSGVKKPTYSISTSTGEIEIILKIDRSYTSFEFFINLFMLLTSKKKLLYTQFKNQWAMLKFSWKWTCGPSILQRRIYLLPISFSAGFKIPKIQF